MIAEKNGTVYIVGIGPGNIDEMSVRARKILMGCDVAIGYKKYIDAVRPLIKDKKICSSGMTYERDRCQLAINEARKEKSVALISGGDAGIYGIGGLLLELVQKEKTAGNIAIEIVPGIPAFVSAASLLGAPIMNDFAVISLSDLLTSWEKIARRLKAAASSDFVICLYNPKSKKRIKQIERAVEIILSSRDSNTPCAVVSNASRDDEKVVKTTLGRILECHIDMHSLVIIGNSETVCQGEWMITPRGYRL